jgi:hypothetical protein
MRKLKLDFEQLHVDSFDTDGVSDRRGTVNGHTGITCFGGGCASENNTYIESCLAGQCPNSYDQPCTTNGGGSCFYPYQPPPRTGMYC